MMAWITIGAMQKNRKSKKVTLYGTYFSLSSNYAGNVIDKPICFKKECEDEAEKLVKHIIQNYLGFKKIPEFSKVILNNLNEKIYKAFTYEIS